MFITIGIAQYFENFQHMRLTQSFIVAPTHCGELAVQNGVSPQFRPEGVVGHIHHGGEFFCGIVHPQAFGGGVVGFHWIFLRKLRKLRNLKNLKGFNGEKMGYRNRIAIICYCFGTFRYHFGTFLNDFKLGANETGIFSICKGIFLNGCGKNFEKCEKKPQTRKKSLDSLRCGKIVSILDCYTLKIVFKFFKKSLRCTGKRSIFLGDTGNNKEKFKIFKMENLKRQPFLLSLQQAAAQTNDLDGYETLLQEQQDAFKEYINDYFNSEKPAPKRFQFLKRAEYEVCRIFRNDADIIKGNDENFYRFWSMLIEDTLTFISIGVDTFEFQARCPAHMLIEPPQKYPVFKWAGSRNDLSECIVGLYQADVIKLQDGSRPSFLLFAKFIGDFFGISYDNPYKDIGKVIDRKRNQTPFLQRIIECLKNRRIKMDE